MTTAPDADDGMVQPRRPQRRGAPRTAPTSRSPTTPTPTPRKDVRRRRIFSIGFVLSETFRIFGLNAPGFLLLGFVIQAPVLAVNLGLAGDAVGKAAVLAGAQWTALLTSFLPYVLQGAVAYGVFREMAGQRVSFADCVARGLGRLPQVIGFALLALLLFGAIGIVPIALLAGVGSPRTSMSSVFFLLAVVMAASIVTTILQCIFYVAVPATAVEDRTGPLRAFARSAFLTKGSRLSIFVILLVYGLVAWLVGQGLITLGFEQVETRAATVLMFVVQYVVGVVLGTLLAVSTAVAYSALRRDKEGVDIRQIIAVFD